MVNTNFIGENIHMDIQHEDNGKRGKFFISENGHNIAAMTYSWSGAKLITIEHTEVSDQLKGQGIGNKLVAAAVDWMRNNDIKVIPLCPFAKKILTRGLEYADILADR